MPRVDVVVDCPVHESFRVQQAAGMFDVPLAERAAERFSVELPEPDEPWRVGLIVGPSGSGKTSVARQAFGDALFTGACWAPDRAVVDGFGDLGTRDVVRLLTAVGFSSPPSWVKPYRVLSRGEQFRCELARALAETTRASPLVVFDEFTSVVDRRVAKVCSIAVAKAVRKQRVAGRFIAVACHYDVAQWLEPDWTLDMATGRLDRRRLRRPNIELEVYRARRNAWSMFARHHYLTGSLAPQARCYVALWEGEPVCFCATLPVIGRKRRRRFTRIVTLPDYQGVGIGTRTAEAVAELHRQEGLRVNVTSGHPALVAHCRGSPLWRAVAVESTGRRRKPTRLGARYRDAAGRAVVSFEYVGE